MKLLSRLLLLFAAIYPVAVNAQAWGPDGPQPVVYPTVSSIAHLDNIRDAVSPTVVIGDGSNAWGGNPPADAFEPADIPNPVVFTDGLQGAANVGGTERKARFICNASHVGRHDAIRGFGSTVYGHDHTFAGNAGVNGSSTFSTLRNESAMPTCPGQKLNQSAYWAVSVYDPDAAGTGQTKIKKPDYVNLYYVGKTGGNYADKFTGIARGLAEITGMDLDDPDGNKPGGRLSEVAAANAINIYGNYTNQGLNTIWYCDDTGAAAAYLADSSGADALSSCPSTSQISARVTGHHCWDGHNLTSPTGRGHVRPYLREGHHGTNVICPQGWYHKPAIEIRWVFSHGGASDYTTWTCPSDATAAASAGRAMGHCESFHVDVIFAWDDRALTAFQDYCIGTEGATFVATCNDATINGTQRLNTTGTTATNRFYGNSLSDFFDIPGGAVSPIRGRAKLRKGS